MSNSTAAVRLWTHPCPAIYVRSSHRGTRCLGCSSFWPRLTFFGLYMTSVRQPVIAFLTMVSTSSDENSAASSWKSITSDHVPLSDQALPARSDISLARIPVSPFCRTNMIVRNRGTVQGSTSSTAANRVGCCEISEKHHSISTRGTTDEGRSSIYIRTLLCDNTGQHGAAPRSSTLAPVI